MASGEICTAVNALFRAVCELKLNNDKDSIKSQMQFFTDLQNNRRALVNSYSLYEYCSSENIEISQDECDLMREFLLTYIGKYTETYINDVFINYVNRTLKFAFVSFERASKTNDTSDFIKELELDVLRVYQNSIFKIIDTIISGLPQDEIITKIKNLQNYFKTGNVSAKLNENILGNYNDLKKYVINSSNKSFIPQFNPLNSNIDSTAQFEPFGPFEPFQPTEPSEPSDIITFDFLSKKIGNFSEDIPNFNEANIKAAIGRILEISTTEELTQV